MTNSTSSRRLVLGALAFLPVLARCSTSPTPRLFTLAPRPAEPAGRFSGSISVRRVELAKYLDRPQIVRYSDPYELRYSEFNRWAEGLGDMVTRIVIENLSERLPGSQVYSAAGPLSLPTPDISLEINIDRFECDQTGMVVLAVQWVAHRGGRAQHRADEIRGSQTNSDDPTAQVVAMSDALGEFANRIAAGLVT